MAIIYNNEGVTLPLFKKRECSKWIKDTVIEESFTVGQLSFIFCSDEYLLNINREYLKHDYFTDVITFNYVVNKIINGDIFISIDRVKENALANNQNFIIELKRVMIHGVLHLIGYNDKTAKEKVIMTQKEDYYLSLVS